MDLLKYPPNEDTGIPVSSFAAVASSASNRLIVGKCMGAFVHYLHCLFFSGFSACMQRSLRGKCFASGSAARSDSAWIRRRPSDIRPSATESATSWWPSQPSRAGANGDAAQTASALVANSPARAPSQPRRAHRTLAIQGSTTSSCHGSLRRQPAPPLPPPLPLPPPPTCGRTPLPQLTWPLSHLCSRVAACRPHQAFSKCLLRRSWLNWGR
jgi:hypothetical protein